MLLLAHAASGAWHHAVAATALISTLRPARAQWQRAVAAITLTSTLRPARGAWQAKGKMEFLWATPVMEYDGLFNEVDCGVPWPSGGLTPSTRLVSIRRARGSSHFRF